MDGELAGTGGPVTIIPATNTWTNGFFVGSDPSGYEQARGVFWYLELNNSNSFLPIWSNDFGANYFTNWWPYLSNGFAAWNGDGGGGSLFQSFGRFTLPPDPTNSVNTNYTDYTNF